MKKWLRELFCWHKWEILGVGQNWPACIMFHDLADTIHECKRCHKKRNWIHTLPVRWNKQLFTQDGKPLANQDKIGPSQDKESV